MMVESYEDGYHGYDTMVGRQAHSFPRAAGPGTGADEDVDSPRDQFNYTSAQDSEAKALMDSHLKEGGSAWEGSEGSGAESKFANLSPLTIHYNDFAPPRERGPGRGGGGDSPRVLRERELLDRGGH